MKTLVAYMSVSGNTKAVAEAIFEEIRGEKEIQSVDNVTGLEEYDLVFVGFPVQQFGTPDLMKEFLRTKVNGKRIALFITHAMPPGMDQLKGILSRCQAAAAGTILVGTFDCQGELAKDVADHLLASPNKNLQEFGRMRDVTTGHPDMGEIEAARSFAKRTMECV
ncbi:MAG TPA: flavodoxin family protein [Methanomassiliicoccales archaeon]|jgi:flavodoxin